MGFCDPLQLPTGAHLSTALLCSLFSPFLHISPFFGSNFGFFFFIFCYSLYIFFLEFYISNNRCHCCQFLYIHILIITLAIIFAFGTTDIDRGRKAVEALFELRTSSQSKLSAINRIDCLDQQYRGTKKKASKYDRTLKLSSSLSNDRLFPISGKNSTLSSLPFLVSVNLLLHLACHGPSHTLLS